MVATISTALTQDPQDLLARLSRKTGIMLKKDPAAAMVRIVHYCYREREQEMLHYIQQEMQGSEGVKANLDKFIAERRRLKDLEYTVSHDTSLPLGLNFTHAPTTLPVYGVTEQARQTVIHRLSQWLLEDFNKLTKKQKAAEVTHIQACLATKATANHLLSFLQLRQTQRSQLLRDTRAGKRLGLKGDDLAKYCTTNPEQPKNIRILETLLAPLQSRITEWKVGEKIRLRVPFNWETIPLTISLRLDIAATIQQMLVLNAEERATWLEQLTANFHKQIVALGTETQAAGLPAPTVTDILSLLQQAKDFNIDSLRYTLRKKLAHRHAQEQIRKTVEQFQKQGSFLARFPKARGIRRHVIARIGPTNSGKTHAAIQALAAAPTGIYLAPLRLLALEKQEELLNLGIPTSLITGEERDVRNGQHACCTIEMLDTNQVYDTAVIDEVQMLADPDRGWAWTNAVCGVAAKTVFLTAPACAEALIRRLVAFCGDTLEVIKTHRTGALIQAPATRWPDVKPQSAIVAFSRQAVLDIKTMLEAQHRKVSVIYGALSPEVRREQARLYREGVTEVIIATDAIGMGLNLPIDYLYFWETDKFDGQQSRKLTVAELNQIAGRAGRGIGGTGLVSSFSKYDHRTIARHLNQPIDLTLAKFQAAPKRDHIAYLAQELKTEKLSEILKFFITHMEAENPELVASVTEDTCFLARMLDAGCPTLSATHKFEWSCAPAGNSEADPKNPLPSMLLDWAQAHAYGLPCQLQVNTKLLSQAETAPELRLLEGLELMLKMVTLYRWLHWRFPASFTQHAEAEDIRRRLNAAILTILEKASKHAHGHRRHCASCGRTLSTRTLYDNCHSCHHSRRSYRDWDYY